MKNGDYILIIPPADYPGKLYRNRYAHEHHVVWWQNTGNTVPEGYVVHHKNENKHDNNFSNLELMPKPLHVSMHNKKRRKPTVHGTLTAWTHHKCKCDKCRSCYNEYMRIYKHIRRSANRQAT